MLILIPLEKYLILAPIATGRKEKPITKLLTSALKGRSDWIDRLAVFEFGIKYQVGVPGWENGIMWGIGYREE